MMDAAKKERWKQRDKRRQAKARAKRADAALYGKPVTVTAVYQASRDSEAWARMGTAKALPGDEAYVTRIAEARTPTEVMAIVRERRAAYLDQ